MKKPKLVSAASESKLKLKLLPSAEKDIERLPNDIQERVFSHIDLLPSKPRLTGAIKLKAKSGLYRLRVGDYRVVYRIELASKVLVIESVRHRKDVYRHLD